MLQSRSKIKRTANTSWRIGIVHSAYHKEEMDRLVRGAADALREAGIPEENISLHGAPGSFEVPLIGAALAESRSVDGLIGLGIIIEGETHHARLLAEQSARGMMDVQLRYRIPFAFEILYVDSLALARARVEKGREAAVAVLHVLSVLKRVSLPEGPHP